MKGWWPGTGLRVNPGRAPTRLGGDGILPFLDVPHWFVDAGIAALGAQRVEFDVLPAYVRQDDSNDPDDHLDPLVFPSERPDRIQMLVDSIKPSGRAKRSPRSHV